MADIPMVGHFSSEIQGTRVVMGRPPTELTPEVCVTAGGHCWEPDESKWSIRGVRHCEMCKHCPATRVGKSQEAMLWTYPEGQA